MRRLRMLAAVGVTLAALLGGFGAAVPAPAAAASADAGAEAEFVDRINGTRSGAGRGTLASDGELTSIARRWSQRMADEQRLSHNPNLADEVQADWEKLAENVGFGGTVSQIHDAFMDSTPHRNNILDGAMTHVGVGVVVDGSGQLWVTQVFMRLRGGGGGAATPPTTAAPPPPPPPPPPAAAPAPGAASPTTTTRAPRVTTAPTARPAPTPSAAPPVTEAPVPAPVPGPASDAAPSSAPGGPTARLVLVLDGLRDLDRGR